MELNRIGCNYPISPQSVAWLQPSDDYESSCKYYSLGMTRASAGL